MAQIPRSDTKECDRRSGSNDGFFSRLRVNNQQKGDRRELIEIEALCILR